MKTRPLTILLIPVISFFALITFNSCSNFTLAKELGITGQRIEISPAAVTLTDGGSVTFTATGGVPPYTFSIAQGTGSIDSASGFYVADDTIGVTLVRVSDSASPPETADALVTISAALGDSVSILPPEITLSTNDTYVFVSIGGTPPYIFTVETGQGTILGAVTSGKFQAPGMEGTSTVKVTDSAIPAASDTSIVNTIESLTILPPFISIPANNNIAFSASGGILPYEFSLEPGSSGSVTLAGFYTAPGGIGEDKVRVTDDIGNFRISTISVTAPQPLVINPKSFIILTDDTFTFTASGGTPPYDFTRVSGTGNIAGNGEYTAAGAAGVDVIQVEDALGLTADAVVRIVEIGPLEILPDSDVTVEQISSFTFAATGGAPPYIYSLISGPGAIDSSTGKYTAPSVLGSDAEIQVADSNIPPDTVTATVYIAPAAPTAFTADGLAGANSEILLNWENNASGEDGFTIEMRILGEAPVYTTDIDVPGLTSYTYGSLSPNVPYVFRIRARHGSVASGWSNEAFGLSK